MSPLSIALVIFACVSAGAALGIWLQKVLPTHHLSKDSKDLVMVATGLIATMAALVLGLLIASAKASFDAQDTEIAQVSADIVTLHRVMVAYGPETKAARDLLREAVTGMIAKGWSLEGSQSSPSDPAAEAGRVLDKLATLSPQNPTQRILLEEAVRANASFSRTRWMLAEQSSAIPRPFVVLLVLWIAIIFGSFGLFAPDNTTVFVTLLMCSLSVSGAIFLILELDRPFEGLIQVSPGPLIRALATLGS